MAHGSSQPDVLHKHGAPHTHTGQVKPLPQRPKNRHIFPDEEIYGLYHPHPVVFLRGLLYPAAAFAVVLIITLAVNTMTVGDPTAENAALLSVGSLLFFAAVLLIAGWIVYIYLDWRADYLLISDRRIILNIETPGIRTVLREVPMGKIQNVTTRHAALNQLVKKLLQVGELVIDTAGLGQVDFHDMREVDADAAQQIIMDLQRGVSEAGKQPRAEYRRQVVQSILQGRELPKQPQRVHVPTTTGQEGYNVLNRLIPRKPWCEGMQIIWHKHWWFLLLELLKPLGLLIGFELANLIVAVAGNILGVGDNNPVLNVLSALRIPVYLILLPFLAWQWENWRNDQYIVTKDQLMSVDTLPFGLQETVKQTEIRRVVDATVTVDGVLPKLLGFGNIVIETPGEATEFIFEGVPHPFDVHREVMTRIEAQREQEQVQWDRDIQEWLRAYVEERRAEPTPQPQPPPDGGSFWW